jgi:hypothetical protein
MYMKDKHFNFFTIYWTLTYVETSVLPGIKSEKQKHIKHSIYVESKALNNLTIIQIQCT